MKSEIAAAAASVAAQNLPVRPNYGCQVRLIQDWGGSEKRFGRRDGWRWGRKEGGWGMKGRENKLKGDEWKGWIDGWD